MDEAQKRQLELLAARFEEWMGARPATPRRPASTTLVRRSASSPGSPRTPPSPRSPMSFPSHLGQYQVSLYETQIEKGGDAGAWLRAARPPAWPPHESSSRGWAVSAWWPSIPPRASASPQSQTPAERGSYTHGSAPHARLDPDRASPRPARPRHPGALLRDRPAPRRAAQPRSLRSRPGHRHAACASGQGWPRSRDSPRSDAQSHPEAISRRPGPSSPRQARLICSFPAAPAAGSSILRISPAS